MQASPEKTPAITFSTLLPWLVALLGIGYCLFFYQLGSYPLLDMDEPRYAEAAREMLERNSWITPTFNYDLRFDKPVFFYWMIGLAYQWFGVNEFAARFFSAFSALLITVSLFLFGSKVHSIRFGALAALFFASAVEVIAIGRMSITDMSLCAWMTLTSLALFMVTYQGKAWWIPAGILSGIAVLTKGPVGVVLPGGILFLYTVLTGQWKQTFKTPWFFSGLAMVGLVALPWYWLAYQENGQIFLDALFLHNITRYTGVVSGHTQHPVFFYLVLLVGFLPWTPFLLRALTYSWLHRKTLWRECKQSVLLQVGLYALIWGISVFTFFNVAKTKLLTYILPMFPALSLFIAAYWDRVMEKTGTEEGFIEQRWIKNLGLLLLVFFLIAGGVFAIFPSIFLPREAKHISHLPAIPYLIGIFIIASVFFIRYIIKRQFTHAVVAQALGLALVVCISLQTLLPNITKTTQGPMLSYLNKIQQAPFATYEITRPSLTFYSRQRVVRIDRNDGKQLTHVLEQNPFTYIITKNSFLDDLHAVLKTLKVKPNQAIKTVHQGPRYSLLKIERAHLPNTLPKTLPPKP